MSLPLRKTSVSIIVPTYNRGNIIAKTINSILAQSYKNYSLIIVNDGSSDNTETIVKRYKDPRITYLKQKHAGPGAARNKGIMNTYERFVAFCDDDDIWHPEKLQMQIKLLDSNEEIDICHTAFLNTATNRVHYYNLDNIDPLLTFIKDGCIIQTPTVIVKRRCFRRVGYFDETLERCQDWDLWIRLAKYYNFKGINKPLAQGVIRDYANINAKKMSHYTDLVILKNINTIKKEFPNRIPSNIEKKINSNIIFRTAKRKFFNKDYRTTRKKLISAIKTYPLNLRAYLYFVLTFLGVDFFDMLLPLYKYIKKGSYSKYL